MLVLRDHEVVSSKQQHSTFSTKTNTGNPFLTLSTTHDNFGTTLVACFLVEKLQEFVSPRQRDPSFEEVCCWIRLLCVVNLHSKLLQSTTNAQQTSETCFSYLFHLRTCCGTSETVSKSWRTNITTECTFCHSVPPLNYTFV